MPLLPALLGLALLAVPAAGIAQQQPAAPAAKAGLVTRDITPAVRRNWRGDSDHSLHVTVWYPAAENAVERPQTIGPPNQPLFLAGAAAPHAAFAPSLAPYPLVLLSHGSGGSAEQLAWLGASLARAGFVAAAVDHPGNNTKDTTAEGFLLPWERATDLSEVLDGLLADPELASHIDRDRIGAAGFSIGGFTVLELAGARADIGVLFDLCRKQPEATTCRVPEMKGMGSAQEMLEAVRRTSGESLARSADSFRDARVHAVLAMAPALGFTQTPESLHGIRIPVELIVGSADTIAPADNNANLLKGGIHGARETVLPGVSHYAFLDTCTPAGVQALPQYCTDSAGREAAHAQVSEQAAQFFRRALKLR